MISAEHSLPTQGSGNVVSFKTLSFLSGVSSHLRFLATRFPTIFFFAL